MDHVDANLQFPIPKIPELSKPKVSEEALSENENLIKQLEEIVEVWQNHIKTVKKKLSDVLRHQQLSHYSKISQILQTYCKKVDEKKGPMAEYNFWHQQENALWALTEQLKSPQITKIFRILHKAESPAILDFQFTRETLEKNYLPAKDNSKFLKTVVKIFQVRL